MGCSSSTEGPQEQQPPLHPTRVNPLEPSLANAIFASSASAAHSRLSPFRLERSSTLRPAAENDVHTPRSPTLASQLRTSRTTPSAARHSTTPGSREPSVRARLLAQQQGLQQRARSITIDAEQNTESITPRPNEDTHALMDLGSVEQWIREVNAASLHTGATSQGQHSLAYSYVTSRGSPQAAPLAAVVQPDDASQSIIDRDVNCPPTITTRVFQQVDQERR